MVEFVPPLNYVSSLNTMCCLRWTWKMLRTLKKFQSKGFMKWKVRVRILISSMVSCQLNWIRNCAMCSLNIRKIKLWSWSLNCTFVDLKKQFFYLIFNYRYYFILLFFIIIFILREKNVKKKRGDNDFFWWGMNFFGLGPMF